MNTSEKLKAINNLLLQKAFFVNYENVSEHLSEMYNLEKYSKRAFYRDINGLKVAIGLRYPTLEDELGPLLKFNKYKNRYTYVRDDISAYPSLSEKELNQIASIIEFNRHLFAGGTGEGLVNKLRAISLENNLTNHNEIIPWPSIQLIKDGKRAGSENLEKLIEFISSKKTIQLIHKGLSETSQSKNLIGLPLMIKEYNNGWFTGWYLLIYEIPSTSQTARPNINDFRLLALDRIESIKPIKTSTKIVYGTNFDPSKYFENCFGIIRNNLSNPELKPERIMIKLEANNWIKSYLEKYPIHITQSIQTIDENTNESLLELDLEVNQELEGFLLRHTDQLTVLHPEILQKNLILKMKKSISNYEALNT